MDDRGKPREVTEIAGSYELRAMRPDELEPYLDALGRAFGEVLSNEVVAAEREVFEPDRFLAVVTRDGAIVGTAGAVTFDLAMPGSATVGCAGVTVVSVRQDHRRRGLLTRMMRRLLDDARERREPLAALWASEGAIYGRYGFGPGIPLLELRVPRAQLRLRAPVPPTGVEVIEPEVALERIPPLYDRARRDRSGMLSRHEGWWRYLLVHDPPDERDGAGPRTIAVLPDGGYVAYRLKPRWQEGVPQATVQVEELLALHPEATATLWSYLAATDLATTIRAPARPIDDPLASLVIDGTQVRASRFSPVYLRILDVAAALEARHYLVDGQLTLAVDDPMYAEVSGTYHLEVADGQARCERGSGPADLRLGIEELSTVLLGAVPPRVLADARRIEQVTAGAVDRLGLLLTAPVAPWQPSEF